MCALGVINKKKKEDIDPLSSLLIDGCDYSGITSIRFPFSSSIKIDPLDGIWNGIWNPICLFVFPSSIPLVE